MCAKLSPSRSWKAARIQRGPFRLASSLGESPGSACHTAWCHVCLLSARHCADGTAQHCERPRNCPRASNCAPRFPVAEPLENRNLKWLGFRVGCPLPSSQKKLILFHAPEPRVGWRWHVCVGGCRARSSPSKVVPVLWHPRQSGRASFLSAFPRADGLCASMAPAPQNARRAPSFHQQRAALAVRAGGVEALVRLIRSSGEQPGVLQRGAEALANVCYRDDIKQRAADAGAVDAGAGSSSAAAGSLVRCRG
jgi:hypothetical protein